MDIFSGANITVEVGTAGSTLATDFKVVPEVAAFTTSGFESTVIDVVTFNSAFNRKLLGTKSTDAIDLTVNYIPDDVVHQLLESLADEQKRCQIRLSYYEDATKTTGFYVVYTAFISGSTIDGDKDKVVNKKFTLAIDGGSLANGVLPKV